MYVYALHQDKTCDLLHINYHANDVKMKRQCSKLTTYNYEDKPRKSRRIQNRTDDEVKNGINFAHGFKPPSQYRSWDAIGLHLESQEDKIVYGFGSKLPLPRHKDDWLAVCRENGQSFQQFQASSMWFHGKAPKHYKSQFNTNGNDLKSRYPEGKIYILPLGKFSENHPPLEELAEYTKLYYDINVGILQNIRLCCDEKDRIFALPGLTPSCDIELKMSQFPGVNFTYSIDKIESEWKPLYLTSRSHQGHLQLRVDSGLLGLITEIPIDALFVVVVTMCDLYADASDLFIAGTGMAKEKFGIFSFYRYDPCISFTDNFWHNVKFVKGENSDQKKNILFKRSCKLLIHEIGHLLGINHCIFYACCMNGSGHLEEDFSQPIHLCPVDLHKIQTLCNVSPLERYRKLYKFYERHNFSDEATWIQNRIKQISGSS